MLPPAAYHTTEHLEPTLAERLIRLVDENVSSLTAHTVFIDDREYITASGTRSNFIEVWLSESMQGLCWLLSVPVVTQKRNYARGGQYAGDKVSDRE